MKLDFIPERLRMIRRLTGLKQSELSDKMCALAKRKNKFGIEKWESGMNPPSDVVVTILAKACGVPVGYFFYKNVDITMDKNLFVTVFIADTNESVTFQLKP